MNATNRDVSNVYVLKAQEEPVALVNDQTGATVGAIASCVIIVAVLVFLWKMLQRKRQDMAQMFGDEEGATNQEPEPNAPQPLEEPNSFSTTRPPAAETKLSNCSGPSDGNDQMPDEMVLPNLSPVASSSWSQKEETNNDDTDNVRKDATLRRRRLKTGTFDELDLDIEHPRDIISSLKRARQSLKREMQERSRKSKEAIEVRNITECQKSLLSARCAAKVKTTKNETEIMKFLRRTREARRRLETKRKYLHNLSFSNEHAHQKREAFVAMQDWFDGLRLRCDVRQIAEEVFLLRSQHRSELDRNENEKAFIKDSLHDLEQCNSTISHAKFMVVEMKQDIVKRRDESSKRLEALHQGKCHASEVTGFDQVRPISDNQQKRFRVKLPKVIVKKDGIDEPPPTSAPSTSGKNCLICKESPCQCHLVSREPRPVLELFETKQAGSSTGPDVITTLPHGIVEARPKNSFPLLLKLVEVKGSGSLNEQGEAQGEDLSEREVRKALNRVPFVTSVGTIVMGSSENEWILNVTASKARLAKVRFICRGRAYAIVML